MGILLVGIDPKTGVGGISKRGHDIERLHGAVTLGASFPVTCIAGGRAIEASKAIKASTPSH